MAFGQISELHRRHRTAVSSRGPAMEDWSVPETRPRQELIRRPMVRQCSTTWTTPRTGPRPGGRVAPGCPAPPAPAGSAVRSTGHTPGGRSAAPGSRSPA